MPEVLEELAEWESKSPGWEPPDTGLLPELLAWESGAFVGEEPKKPKRLHPIRDELTEEERQQIIGTVEPLGVFEEIAGKTIPGLAARAINRAFTDEPYVEPATPERGFWARHAIDLAAFVGDPTNIALAGGGKVVGQALMRRLGPEAAERLGRYGASAAEKAASAGTFLGGHAAVSDPLRQYAETGEVDPGEYAKSVGVGTVTGIALGPAAALGRVPAGATLAQRAVGAAKAIPAEILAFATVPAALEGGAPTLEDLGGATFAVVGIRGVHLSLNGLLKLGKLGRKETPPSRKEFAEATGLDPKDVPPAEMRMRAAVDAMEKAQAIQDAIAGIQTIPPKPGVPAADVAAGVESEVPPGVSIPVKLGEPTDAKGQVSDVRGVEGGRGLEREGGEDYQRGREAGADKPPEEKGQEGVLAPDPFEAEILADYQAAKATETAKAPPPETPPSAEAGDRPPMMSTAIRKAVMNEERVERGLQAFEEIAPFTDREAIEGARERVARNPYAGPELVASLEKEPRALDKTDVALLDVYRIDKRVEHNRLLGEIDEALKSGETERVTTLTAEERAADAELSRIEEVGRLGVRSSAQALQATQIDVMEDKSFSTMLRKEQALRSRYIPPDDPIYAEVKAISERALKNEKAYQEALAKIEQLEIERALDDQIEKRTERFTKRRSKRSEEARREVDAAWEELIVEATGKLFSIEGTPQLLAPALKLARAYVKLGVVRWEEFWQRAQRRLGERADKARDLLRQAWDQAISEERPEAPGQLESRGEAAAYARQLMEYFLETGVRGRERIVAAVWGELRKAIPGITERQTMEALSGYGDYKPPTTDEIKLEMYDTRRQLQEVLKVQDMEAGRAPLKTGRGRPEPTDEERRLVQKTNEMKRRGGFVVTDPETQARSALQSMKTRLRNQISDLGVQIETRERTVRRVGKVAPDAEARALIAERDLLKAQFDEVFGKRELTDAQRVSIAAQAIQRSMAEYTRRIRERDLTPSKKPSKTPASSELDRLRAERDALKAEYKTMQDLANPKKTPDQRATAALEASLRRKLAKNTEMLARGDRDPDFDYAKPIKKETQVNPEIERLRRDNEKMDQEIARRRLRIQQQNRTMTRKIAEFAGDVVFNVSRGIAFGLDVSFTSLQGGLFSIAHPIRAARNFESALAAWSTEDGASADMHQLTQRPRAKSGEFKRAKLAFSDPHGKLRMQEETVASYLADKIPVLRNFNRAWSSFMNNTRADWYDTLAESASRKAGGKLSIKQEQALGKAMNIFTGRGDFGAAERAVPVLNAVFLAPKYVLSRFQLILGEPLRKGDAVTRVVIAKEYGRILVSFAAIHSLIYAGLYAAYGPPGDYWEMNFDPSSDKKMGIRIGARTIDTSAGIFSALRFMTRMGIALIGSEEWAQRAELDRPIQEAFTYGRGKLAPVLGAGASRLAKTTMESRPDHPVPATMGNLARGLIEPINVSDIAESMTSYGMTWEKALGLLNLFGVNVRTDRYNQAMYERQFGRQMQAKEAG